MAGLIGIDFEFPTLAEIQQRIERFFDGLRLPSLNLFGGSTDDDAEQEAGRAIDIWEGVGDAIRETESEIEKFERRFGTLEGVMSRTLPRIQDVGVQVAGLGDSFRIAIDAFTPSADALTATVDIWEGLADTAPPEGALERIVAAADAAFVEALARVGTDFSEDLNRRYIPIASPEQLAAFERQQDDLVTKTKETAAAIQEAAAGGAGAAVERATELSADQLKSLERLRDAYDPLGAAASEFAEAQALIADALAAGNIGLLEAARLSAAVATEYEALLDPLSALIDEYNREISILEVPTGQRDVVSQLRTDLEALRDAGVDVTAGQAEALREQIQAFEDAQDAIQRQGQAYKSLQDPLGEYLKNLEALNAVLAQHPELADQAAQAQDALRLAFLDTQTDPLSGLERGAIRLAMEFGDSAKLTEEAFMNAFKGAEDALVNFVRTGKLEFGDLVDTILDDIARIVIRDTITGPISAAISGAIRGGVSGEAGAGGGLGSLFSGFLSSLGSIFTSEEGGGGFLSGLGGIFQSGASLFGNIFNTLFSGLGSIFGGGEGGFLGGLGSIFNSVLGGFSKILGIGGEGGGFLGGLGSIFSQGASAIGSVVSSVGNAIGGALGLGGAGAAAAGSGLGGLGLAAGGSGAAAGGAAAGGAAAGGLAGAASLALPVLAVLAPVVAPELVAGAVNAVHEAFNFIFGSGAARFSEEQRRLLNGVISALENGTATAALLNQDLAVTRTALIAIEQRLTGQATESEFGLGPQENIEDIVTATGQLSAALQALPDDIQSRFRRVLEEVESALTTDEAARAETLGASQALQAAILSGAVTTEQLTADIDLTRASIDVLVQSLEQASQTNADQANLLAAALADAANTILSLPENISAQLSVQIGNIRSIFERLGEVPEAASGGRITGPGTGTSDSILARLSDGEFVVNAMATQRHLALLHAVNDNRPLPQFQRGGPVVGFQAGGRVSVPSAARGGLTVNVINNRPGNAIEVEEVDRGDGERELRIMIDEETEEFVERGGLDRAVSRRYGLRARVA